MSENKLDVLAFGAHPDDVELGCGGALARMIRFGYNVGICDLTRGEMGTRGTPELREKEAQEAARLLGVKLRLNLNLPDGNIPDQVPRTLVEVIRRLTPQIVFAPYWEDRHPDHGRASRLVTEGCFKAGLGNYEADYEPYRPPWIFYYMQHFEFEPSFVVDISEEFDRKMSAVKAFRSQTHSSEYKGASEEPETLISSEYFLTLVETRARYYGSLTGVTFGEPFRMRQVIGIGDPVSFFTSGKNVRNM